MDISLLSNIAATRFANRWVEDPGGGGYFRMTDGRGAVRLTGAEWSAVAESYRAASAAASRRCNRRSLFTIPAVIGIAVAAPLIAEPFKEWLGWLPGFLLVAALFGLPLRATIMQVHEKQRALEEVEASLRRRPRCPLPDLPDRRWFNVLQMLALAALVPTIVQLYGSFNPGAYRNTPLSGTSLNWIGYCGMVLLAAVLVIRIGRGPKQGRPS